MECGLCKDRLPISGAARVDQTLVQRILTWVCEIDQTLPKIDVSKVSNQWCHVCFGLSASVLQNLCDVGERIQRRKLKDQAGQPVQVPTNARSPINLSPLAATVTVKEEQLTDTGDCILDSNSASDQSDASNGDQQPEQPLSKRQRAENYHGNHPVSINSFHSNSTNMESMQSSQLMFPNLMSVVTPEFTDPAIFPVKLENAAEFVKGLPGQMASRGFFGYQPFQSLPGFHQAGNQSQVSTQLHPFIASLASANERYKASQMMSSPQKNPVSLSNPLEIFPTTATVSAGSVTSPTPGEQYTNQIKTPSGETITLADNARPRRHHGSESFPCHICGQVLRSEKWLNNHLYKHSLHGDTKKKFVLPKPQSGVQSTGETFGNGPTHSNQSVIDLSPKITSGDVSSQTAAAAAAAAAAVAGSDDNEGIFPCGVCGQILSTEKQMEAHMKKHLSQAIIECPVCFKQFTDRKNYKRHSRLHDEDTPYKCNICGKRCGRNKDLKLHIMRHMTSMQCRICGAVMKNLQALKEHLLSHNESLNPPTMDPDSINLSNIEPVLMGFDPLKDDGKDLDLADPQKLLATHASRLNLVADSLNDISDGVIDSSEELNSSKSPSEASSVGNLNIATPQLDENSLGDENLADDTNVNFEVIASITGQCSKNTLDIIPPNVLVPGQNGERDKLRCPDENGNQVAQSQGGTVLNSNGHKNGAVLQNGNKSVEMKSASSMDAVMNGKYESINTPLVSTSQTYQTQSEDQEIAVTPRSDAVSQNSKTGVNDMSSQLDKKQGQTAVSKSSPSNVPEIPQFDADSSV